MSVKAIFGTAGITSLSTDAVDEVLPILREYNINELDTASIYTGSEAALGTHGASGSFIIHTKAPGFFPGSLSRSSILGAMERSLEALKLTSVETYFLHSPDPQTPIEESLEAVQELYKLGKFHKFGLSNFSVSEVKSIHALAAERGYVVPTVYQGNYNPISRHCEHDLFPVLRKLKMSFWAYSPLAGGFLVKSPQVIREGNQGRWDRSSIVGKVYLGMYAKPSLIEALERWESVAESIGVTKASLAYRWVRYHSALNADNGDCIIVGASSPAQLRETLQGLEEGPLPARVLPEIADIWEMPLTDKVECVEARDIDVRQLVPAVGAMVMLNNVDKAGTTNSGFVFELINDVKACVRIPVIASSGEHFKKVFGEPSTEDAALLVQACSSVGRYRRTDR